MRLPRVSLVALAILLVLAAIGAAAYRDYGASWDEPLFYDYAHAIRSAYSIEAFFEGDLQLEGTYGSSPHDHKIYGPAYLLLVGTIVESLGGGTAAEVFDQWHLVNFLSFLLGAWWLFALSRRWMSDAAATGVAVLFVTQPLLWGHAFINPKDIPFMSFMILAVLTGFNMIEAGLDNPPSGHADLTSNGPRVDVSRRTAPARQGTQRKARTWGLVGLGILLVLLALSRATILGAVAGIVEEAYSKPDSIAGRLLRLASSSTEMLPVSAYVRKAGILAMRARLVSMLAAGSCSVGLGVLLLRPPQRRSAWYAIMAGCSLGIVTSIRVLGPMACALTLLLAVLRPSARHLRALPLYAATSLAVTYASWPYLWPDPLGRFLKVLRHMASNPELLEVLYRSRIFLSNSLPWHYLPNLLLRTLTETVIVLSTLGMLIIVYRRCRHVPQPRSLVPVVAWLALPMAYVVPTTPPMYDGYRHFLFVLPPILILAGIGLDRILRRIQGRYKQWIVILVAATPGIAGIVALHPYEYTYYNLASGGMAAASRHYETDYWLTCYREAMSSPALSGYDTVFVFRQPSLAGLYASPGTSTRGYDPDSPPALIPENSALLLTTRANGDLLIRPADPIVFEVGRLGASFCVVKSLNPDIDTTRELGQGIPDS